MVRITTVTTKTGDCGMTHLAGGKRVPKVSQRIEAIGCIDELNAFMGFVVEACAQNTQFDELKNKMIRIQNELFDLGTQLAVLTEDRKSNTPSILQQDIKSLENELDEMNGTLPTLKSFILPGGNEIAARLHIVRTVCRRAERSVLRLAEIEKLDNEVVPYLNRLGDWLFVASRFVIIRSGGIEILWQPGKRN